MAEKWKPIKEYEGQYEVSNLGNVRSLRRKATNGKGFQKKKNRLLKPNINKGYATVTLCKDGKPKVFLVHRLVAIAFIPNPEGKPIVDHIDTNPLNNTVDNLRWCTQKENCNNPKSCANNSLSKMGHPAYCPPEVSRQNIKRAHEASRGKPFSNEHKKALSEAHRNSEKAQIATKENIKKAQEHNRGKHHSEETKKKLSESHKGILKGRTWKVVDGKRVWSDRKDE